MDKGDMLTCYHNRHREEEDGKRRWGCGGGFVFPGTGCKRGVRMTGGGPESEPHAAHSNKAFVVVWAFMVSAEPRRGHICISR